MTLARLGLRPPGRFLASMNAASVTHHWHVPSLSRWTW
jgi:hypothetical protein